MLTLGQAKQDLAIQDAMGSGEPKSPQAHLRYNRSIDRAVRQLLRKGDWHTALQEYCFNTCEGCLHLPPEIKRVVSIDLNCNLARVFDRHFRYLDQGPGMCSTTMCGPEGIHDAGLTQVLQQPKSPTGLAVILDSCDSGVEVSIQARDQHGKTITTFGQCGEGCQQSIKIKPTFGKIQTFEFPIVAEICQVTKGATCGAVYLYEYDCHTRKVGNLITTLYPEDTFPQYRKYNLGDMFNPAPQAIRLLAKRKHRVLHDDTQALMVDSPDAVAMMLKYNEALKDENPTMADFYLNEALNFMDDSEMDYSDESDEVRYNFERTVRVSGEPGLRSGGW